MGCPVLPAWDTFILILPCLGLLGLYIFGLDELVAAPRRRPKSRRSFCQTDARGASYISDPDGNLWQNGGRNGQIEARFASPDSERRKGQQRGEPRVPMVTTYIVES